MELNYKFQRCETSEDYDHANRVIMMSSEDANLLVCYIVMTTQYRRSEAEAWRKLAQEKAQDGTPLFTHAQSNAEYYENLEGRLKRIRKIIDNSPFVKGE